MNCKHGVPLVFCPECYMPKYPVISRRGLLSGVAAMLAAPKAYSFAKPEEHYPFRGIDRVPQAFLLSEDRVPLSAAAFDAALKSLYRHIPMGSSYDPMHASVQPWERRIACSAEIEWEDSEGMVHAEAVSVVRR